MEIKAILFDMVGVLFFKKENYVPTTQDEINVENIEKLFNHIDDGKLLKDINDKLQLNAEEIEKAVSSIPNKFEPFINLWNLLPKIKKHYKIAVVNNGNSIALKFWKEKADFSIFNLFINSGVLGIKKPDPKIYLLTCEKLGVNPKECLFMDDSLENIEAAKNLGMKTIWWVEARKKGIYLKEFTNLVH
ncbi:MAG: HAD family hydrolase [Candidatus Microgenomates bacterium]|jgi:putative hydrolase of the HAD superfamily